MGRPNRIARDLLAHAYEIDSLQPDPENARKHPEDSLAAIRASFDTFGQQRALLIYRFKKGEKPTVISGNGGWLAAKSLGWTKVAATFFVGTAAEARAYAIADNRSAELSEWDAAVLSVATAAARANEHLAGLMDALLIDDLLPAAVTYASEDGPAIEPPADPISKPGDVWRLGTHTVVCGNALNLADVSRALGGRQVDCIWTDPPYNIGITGGDHRKTVAQRRAGGALEIAGDNLSEEQFAKFLDGSFGIMARTLVPGGAIYLAHAPSESLLFLAGFARSGFKLSSSLIWRKHRIGFARSDYQWEHEAILYGWKPGKAHRWFGGREQGTILEADRPSASAEHPTMKPLWLIAQMLVNSTRPGDLVLDPFGGSGSTLMACDDLGRECATVEIDPRYVDVIVARWERRSGRKAERA